MFPAFGNLLLNFNSHTLFMPCTNTPKQIPCMGKTQLEITRIQILMRELFKVCFTHMEGFSGSYPVNMAFL